MKERGKNPYKQTKTQTSSCFKPEVKMLSEKQNSAVLVGVCSEKEAGKLLGSKINEEL